jgi:hypothetical protein
VATSATQILLMQALGRRLPFLSVDAAMSTIFVIQIEPPEGGYIDFIF